MRLKLFSFVLFVAGTGCLSPSYSQAGLVTMTFAGIANGHAIGNYYNGGAGPDYGVSYSSNALALTSGSFSNEPSPPTILYWSSGQAAMNVASGFDTGLSFYYAAAESFTVDIYSGLNGTGTLLESQSEATTPNPYHVWDEVNITFSGTAESAEFVGGAGFVGLDNISLTNDLYSAVPEPASITMTAFGVLAVAGTWYRRRRVASTA